jgi:hypothetical protein
MTVGGWQALPLTDFALLVPLEERQSDASRLPPNVVGS